jgi:cephalosporin hydroxylase/methionyl-tRNA formyltransferase
MNNLFLCDGLVGLHICRWLIDHYKEDVGLLVTISDNQIKQAAKEAEVACMSVRDKRQLLNDIQTYGQIFDWGFLIWWPWIIDTDLISLPRNGFINTHPSLLPYNRGKYPNFWAIVEGAPFGVSLHIVDSGIDSGDIIAQLPIPYGWEDNGASLYEAATRAIVDLFKETYPKIRQGKFSRTPQDPTKGSFHFSKELDSASRIDLEKRYLARDLLNLLRARTFPGYPACWFQDEGETYEVRVVIKRKAMSSYEHFKLNCCEEIRVQGSDLDILKETRAWMIRANAHKYSYHFEWLGRPIIQYPQDIVAMQELIWQIKPDLIIETGIAHGGSLILSASMLALLDMCDAIEAGQMLDPRTSRRKVLGIDIEIRPHNRAAIEAHPMASRIQMIEGSSIAPEVIAQVKAIAQGYERVLVCLDSNHTHDHVLAELEAYAPLVSVGSYCVVFDTIIEDMPPGSFPDRPWDKGNNPKTAVWEYLKTHPEFEIDKSIQHKLLITVAPDGYLKRVR